MAVITSPCQHCAGTDTAAPDHSICVILPCSVLPSPFDKSQGKGYLAWGADLPA